MIHDGLARQVERQAAITRASSWSAREAALVCSAPMMRQTITVGVGLPERPPHGRRRRAAFSHLPGSTLSSARQDLRAVRLASNQSHRHLLPKSTPFERAEQIAPFLTDCVSAPAIAVIAGRDR